MTSTTNTSQGTTFMTVLTACVVLAGTASLLAAPTATYRSSEFATLPEIAAPGSPFDAMFADWGLDTSADLNCDGTIDIHDFLDAMSLGDDILLINVITHWGTGSAYDLDCDGTVGMTDYLLLLADMADVAGQAEP